MNEMRPAQPTGLRSLYFFIIVLLLFFLIPQNSLAWFGRYRAKAWGSAFSVNRFSGVEKKYRVDVGMVRDHFFEFGIVSMFSQNSTWYFAPLGLYFPLHATKWGTLGLNSRLYLFPNQELFSTDPQNPRILDFAIRLDLPLVSIATGYRYQKGSWKDGFGEVNHPKMTGNFIEVSFGLSGPTFSADEIYEEPHKFIAGGFFKGNYDTQFDYDAYHERKFTEERKKNAEKHRKEAERIAKSPIKIEIEFPEKTFKLDAEGNFRMEVKIINRGRRAVSQLQYFVEFEDAHLINQSGSGSGDSPGFIFYLPSGYLKLLKLDLQYPGLAKKEKIKVKVICFSDEGQEFKKSTKIKLVPYTD